MSGAGQRQSHPRRGTISYTPAVSEDYSQPPRFPGPLCRPRQRRPNSIHITRLSARHLAVDRNSPPAPKALIKSSRLRIEVRKLASRESAKRVLGSIFPSLSSSIASPPTAESSHPSTPSSSRPPSFAAGAADCTSLYWRRSSGNTTGLDGSAMPEPVASGQALGPSGDAPLGMSKKDLSYIAEKPVCSGSGVACYIVLAEPTIFLTGLDHDGTSRDSHPSHSSAMLRGVLRLNVSKSAKIKAITLKFTGRARTEWPEGIPPAKTETFEEESLRTQVIPFFNALYEGSESGYGTLCNYILRQKSATSSVMSLSGNHSATSLHSPTTPTGQTGISLPHLVGRSSRSSSILSAKDLKRLSLQNTQARSFQKSDSPYGPTPQQKGYKTFHPGVYEYSFELPLDNSSPETTHLPLASVKWSLEALVERSGTFKPNLQGFKEVPVVRSPSEDSLELVEPISISRKWEDQLYYEIMISGKSFPLGTRIPIAFKLTPLAKVRIHKLKVYVTENMEYFTSNRRVARRETARKILLLEKVAGKPLAKEYNASEVRVLAGGEMSTEERVQARESTMRYRERLANMQGTSAEPLPEPTENILGELDLGEQYWGQTEIEMNVQLPTCEMIERDKSKRLVHDCTWKNVNVHHWIKIVLRISRLDHDDPEGKKRRHFEISIDSPFTILNCRATRDNLMLPQYSNMNATSLGQQHVCGCPNAATTATMRSESLLSEEARDIPDGPESVVPPHLTRPPQAHLSGGNPQRPMHMLRQPSFNPPAFDEDSPPPPLPTPPPLYDHVIGTPSHDGLADYFARLGETYDEDNNTDDEDLSRITSRGRVNVMNPRTSSGRIARSMDIDRNFMFNPTAAAAIISPLRRETRPDTPPVETSVEPTSVEAT